MKINLDTDGQSPSKPITAEYVKYLDFLDNQAKHSDVLSGLAALITNTNKTALMSINDVTSIRTLIRLCNKYACKLIIEKKFDAVLDFFEYAKLLLRSPLLENDADSERLKLCIFNNLGVYSLKIEDSELALKFSKSAIQKGSKTSMEFQAIALNNLSNIFFKKTIYEKALQAQVRGLAVIEERVFKDIRSEANNVMILTQNKEFNSSLKIMLVGYLNMGLCIEKINQMEDGSTKNEINKTKSDSLKFYYNGYKLAKQFLGEQNFLSKCFKKCLTRFKLREESFKTIDRSKNSTQKHKDQEESLSSISQGDAKKSPPISEIKVPRSMTPNNKRRDSREFIIHSSSSLNNSQAASDSATYEESERKSENVSLDKQTSKNILSQNQNPLINPNLSKIFESRSPFLNELGDNKKSFSSSLAVVFQSQMNIEEAIARKIEETLKKAKQEEEEHRIAQKKLEVEAKIEELRRENEQFRKSKLEKECELAELKIKLKTITETMEMQSINNSMNGNYPPNRSQMLVPPHNMGSPPILNMPQSHYMPLHYYYPPSPYHIGPEMMPYYHPNSFFPSPAKQQPNNLQPKLKNLSQNVEEEFPDNLSQSPMLFSYDGYKMRGLRADLAVRKTFSEEISIEKKIDGTPVSQRSANQTPKLPISRRDLLSPNSAESQADIRLIQIQKALLRTAQKSNESPTRGTSTLIFNDEEDTPLIYKTETFGAGAIAQVVNELRRAAALRTPPRSRTEIAEALIEVMNEKSNSEASTHNHIGSHTSSSQDFNLQARATVNLKTETNIPHIVMPTEGRGVVSTITHNNLNERKDNGEQTDRTTVSIFAKDQNEKHQNEKQTQQNDDQQTNQLFKIELTKVPSGVVDKIKTQSSISESVNYQSGINSQLTILEPIRRSSIKIEQTKFEPPKNQLNILGSTKVEHSKSGPLTTQLPKQGSSNNILRKLETPNNDQYESQHLDYSKADQPQKNISKDMSKKGSQKKILDLTKKDSYSSADMSNPQKILPSYSKLDIEFDEVSMLKDSPRNEALYMPNGWQDILGGGFVSPRPFQLLDVPELMRFPEKSVLKQCYFGLDDEHIYTLECHFITAVDHQLRFVLHQKAPHWENSIQIAEENIKVKDLRTVLEFIDYKDILPPISTVKSVKTYKSFIRYFVLPFLWVVPGDSKIRPRIEIRAKPRGLLFPIHECEFLGEPCRISVYYVGGTNLRLVLDCLK